MKFHFFNDGFILLSLRFIHSIIIVLANNLAIGWHLHNIQFIDIPELTGFGHGRAGHTCQLMIHAEVILKRDGRISLGGSLHFDMLFGFHSLMQAVTPSATFHDTSRLLIHNFNLTILNDVFVVEIKHCVGLEQLLKRMNALALNRIVVVHFVLFRQTLLVRQGHSLDFCHLGSNIGQDKQGCILHLVCQPLISLIRKIHTVLLLIHDKEQGLHGLRHAPVVVLHIDFLRSQHSALDARLGKELDEGFVLGQGLVGTEKREESVGRFLLVAFCCAFSDQFLGLSQILRCQRTLNTHQALHQRLIFFKHLVVTFGHRAGNNQRRTGIVDEHGVHLVHNCVIVGTLHQLRRILGHIVTQIVEAELIVGTKGDVTLICPATGLGIGLMLVDTVHRQTV